MLPHKSHNSATPKSGDSKLSRRSFLALGAGSAAACSGPSPANFRSANAVATGTFAHGVASGDPRADSVVLWTRVTPSVQDRAIGTGVAVICELATSADFSDARRIEALARPARDWCVKIVPTGLTPSTLYHYRFRTGTDVSRPGQTRTLPTGAVETARFAVTSCANWQEGYFHAYDQIARRHASNPYDALLMLGDYLYEYGEAEDAVRPHEPAHEIVTLSDYRTRHAQYRTDPDLQAATALMPVIPIWDDHETANDSWQDGAQNHQPATEGGWDDRVAAAMRAYYDWMPIRDADDPTTLWRSFEWGDLLTLTCVETRLTARSESRDISDYYEAIVADPDALDREIYGTPDREMFGQAQLDFIVDSFARSKQAGQPWRVLANQVILSKLATPDLTPYVGDDAADAIRPVWAGIDQFLELSTLNVPLYPDSWDGYPAARERFYSALKGAGVTDMLVLTGDAHEFWANQLADDAGTRMGAEIVTSSVSSSTLSKFLRDNTADFNLLLTRENADSRFYDATTRGFTDLTITPKKATVEMVGIAGVENAGSYDVRRTARFTVRPSGESLKITSPKGLNLKQRLLFSGFG